MGWVKRNVYVLFWAFSLVVLVLAVFYLIVGSFARIGSLIAASYLEIVGASLLIALEEAVKSIRFTLAVRALGRKLRNLDAIRLHFASLAVGILTPAFSGALPTQAAMIGDILGVPPAEAIALAMSVSFFDTVIPSVVTIEASFMLFPYSVPLLLIAAGVVMLWALIIGGPVIDEVGHLIATYVGSPRVRGFIEDEAAGLRPRLTRVLGNSTVFTELLAVSVASYLIEGLSMFVLTGGRVAGYLRDVTAVLMSYVGGSLPTPGGVGGVEYSLVLIVPRGVVVLWRTSYLLVSATALMLLGDVVKHYIGYARFLARMVKEAR